MLRLNVFLNPYSWEGTDLGYHTWCLFIAPRVTFYWRSWAFKVCNFPFVLLSERWYSIWFSWKCSYKPEAGPEQLCNYQGEGIIWGKAWVGFILELSLVMNSIISRQDDHWEWKEVGSGPCSVTDPESGYTLYSQGCCLDSVPKAISLWAQCESCQVKHRHHGSSDDHSPPPTPQVPMVTPVPLPTRSWTVLQPHCDPVPSRPPRVNCQWLFTAGTQNGKLSCSLGMDDYFTSDFHQNALTFSI